MNASAWRLPALLPAAALSAVPLALLVSASLGPPGARALDGWREALSLPQLPRAVAGTLLISAAAAALAVLAGGAGALLLARRRVPGRACWRLLLAAPVLVPQTALAAAWVLLTDRPGASWSPFTAAGLTLVLAACAAPLAFLLLEDAFARQDPALEDAARVHGAGEAAVLRRVILPGAASPAAAAALVCFLAAASALGPQAVIGLPAGVWTVPNLLYTRWGFYGTHPSSIPALALLLLALAAPAALLLPRAGEALALAPRPAALPPRPAAGAATLAALAALAALLTLLPLSALALGSLEGGAWRALAESAAWRGAFARSLGLAAAAALLAGVLGTALAAFAARPGGRGAALADAAGAWPLAWSATALAAAWSAAGGARAPAALLLLAVYALRALAPVYLAARGALAGAPRALEDAALAHGAGSLRAARVALWPAARPAVAGAAALAFAASFREIEASVLLAAPGADTFGTAAFAAWTGGQTAALCAAALAGAALSGACVALILALGSSS